MKKNQLILSSLLAAISLCFTATVASTLERQLIVPVEGKRRAIDASQFSATIIDGLDCSQLKTVDRLTLQGQSFAAHDLDLDNGKVAVAVVLSYCVATQQSALFIIDRNSTTLVQIPGSRRLNDPNTTYALNSIVDLKYHEGTLGVINADASGTESLLRFSTSGEYLGCEDLQKGESRSLCPRSNR